MPIAVDCPCGKTLRLRDDLAGMRVKCPECGDAVDVPEQTESESPFVTVPEQPSFQITEPKPVRRHGGMSKPITGKPVMSYNGVLLPTMFGRAELILEPSRLVEETKKLLSARHAQFLLSEVESAEILTHRNPLLLILGLVTLPIFVGVLFLLLYFILKYKSLVIHSQSNVAAIGIQGSEAPYFEFLDAVLDAAEKAHIITK